MELLHRRCCGLDVHKETVVACLRLVADGKVTTEVRTFKTTTADLLRLSEWLAANDCTHVAMEATGVYCWGGRPPTASMCQNEVVSDLIWINDLKQRSRP